MPDYTISEIESSKLNEWDEFVKFSPQGTLFSTSAWKQIIESGTGFKLRFIGVFRNDNLVGGVSFMEKKQLGCLCALQPLCTPYLGIILPERITTKISDAISREHASIKHICRFLEKHYAQTDLVNEPAFLDARPLLRRKWIVKPRFTYRLAINDPDKNWKEFDGSLRRAIKKAEKSNLEIKETITGDAEGIHSLVDDTLSRKGGKNPVPENLTRMIATNEELTHGRTILEARSSEGKLISALVTVSDWRRAYYSIATTDPAYLSTGVNSLLVWRMINILSEKGVTELDFQGANIQSIARYKEHFNPQIVSHFRIQKWTNPVFEKAKKAGRRILGR